jgi:hypothetical protein
MLCTAGEFVSPKLRVNKIKGVRARFGSPLE